MLSILTSNTAAWGKIKIVESSWNQYNEDPACKIKLLSSTSIITITKLSKIINPVNT